MQLLSEAESWKLFCRTAIPNNVIDNRPPELKVFGEKMVKKCAGLPLAIAVLGGLLSSKKQLPTVWEQVLNKLQVPFSEGNGVDAILSLSFIDLPHNLKSCFLYLGLFPEDWVIPKRELLLLWITEGFIPQQDEQRMEDTAEDYLNELINRNLIQVVAVSINERSKKCRVHDLVRDLCIKKAKKQKLFEIQNNIVHVPSSCSSHPSTKCRRQGIHFGSGGKFDLEMVEFSNSIAKLENLRSLYLEAYPPGMPSFVMNSWLHLSKLQIKGRIPQLPHARQFPPSLTQLTLEETELDYDPMAILEKLQKLLTLRLRKDSYLGEEMQVSAHGFPRLKVIQLFGLNRTRRLNIEKGGMSKLTQLQVFESVLDINGLSKLLLLQKVDVITTSLDHHP
uniref:Disease resistance protein RPP8-Lc n=1 Tax=Vitis vinifera TaxID=29760 RepID=A0A876EQ21_VITVI|nr:disease resistance protein RPP8-Lc [Vitis vinifera]